MGHLHREKLAIVGGIIFLFLLCELARKEELVYKKFEGKGEKPF